MSKRKILVLLAIFIVLITCGAMLNKVEAAFDYPTLEGSSVSTYAARATENSGDDSEGVTYINEAVDIDYIINNNLFYKDALDELEYLFCLQPNAPLPYIEERFRIVGFDDESYKEDSAVLGWLYNKYYTQLSGTYDIDHDNNQRPANLTGTKYTYNISREIVSLEVKDYESSLDNVSKYILATIGEKSVPTDSNSKNFLADYPNETPYQLALWLSLYSDSDDWITWNEWETNAPGTHPIHAYRTTETRAREIVKLAEKIYNEALAYEKYKKTTIKEPTCSVEEKVFTYDETTKVATIGPIKVNYNNLQYTYNGTTLSVGELTPILTAGDGNTKITNYTITNKNGTTVDQIPNGENFYIKIPQANNYTKINLMLLFEYLDEMTATAKQITGVMEYYKYENKYMVSTGAFATLQSMCLVPDTSITYKTYELPISFELEPEDGKYSLQIKKVNENGTALSGAKFTVNGSTKTTNANGIADFATKTINSVTTDTYTITEVTAPDGYKKINTNITVEVKTKLVNNKYVVDKVTAKGLPDGVVVAEVEQGEDGQVITLTIKNEKLKGKYSLQIKKVDKFTGESLEDAQFNVNGNTLPKGGTGDDGIASIVTNEVVNEERTDTYTITEVVSPMGYMLDKTNITVQVKMKTSDLGDKYVIDATLLSGDSIAELIVNETTGMITVEIKNVPFLTIAGHVWLDDAETKEGTTKDPNGIMNNDEVKKPNVVVKLYDDSNNYLNKFKITDDDGYYEFTELDRSKKYKVKFSYDGMTYEPTTYLAGKNPGNYQSDPNGDDYKNTSKAEESTSERKTFNNKFTEIFGKGSAFLKNGITEGQAKGYAEDKRTVLDLKYRLFEIKMKDSPSTYESRLITTAKNEKETGQALQDFIMDSTTGQALPDFIMNSTTGTYPFEDAMKKSDAELEYLKHINLGLKKRDVADLRIAVGIAAGATTIKDKVTVTNYGEIVTPEDLTQDLSSVADEEIKHQISASDYNWAKEFENIYGENASIGFNVVNDQLNVYVLYEIKLKNQISSNIGVVTGVVDYFDNRLEMIEDEKEKEKVASIFSEFKPPVGATSWTDDKTPVVWKSNDDIVSNYTSIETSGLNLNLGKGGEKSIYLILKVKNNGDVLHTGVGNGIKNIAEITSYMIKDEDGNAAGLVDRDSAPYNATPGKKETYEDDTYVAPMFSIELNWEPWKIGGNVWDDFNKDSKKNNSEKGIQNVKVELVEYTESGEIVRPGLIINNTSLKTDTRRAIRTDTNGNYSFNVESGNYAIRFTYGDEVMLKDVNVRKYNAQDYQSSKLTDMCKASDDANRRTEIIKNAKVLTYEKAALLNQLGGTGTILEKDITTLIEDYTEITAKSEKVSIDATEEFDPFVARMIDIHLGLSERPKVDLELTKKVTRLVIKANDGTVLIDTSDATKLENLQKLDDIQSTFVNMDPELMDGATVDIDYKIIVENTSDLAAKATIYDYVNVNLEYREADNAAGTWQIVKNDDLVIADDIKATLSSEDQRLVSKVLRTSTGNIKPGKSVEIPIHLGITLAENTSENELDDAIFSNCAEIVVMETEEGRRDYDSVPGNYIPYSDPNNDEDDSDITGTTSITPPLGEEKAVYYVLTSIVMVILIAGVIMIQRKVLKK